MAQYVARERKITAVKLTKELIVEQGNWLVIEGDKVFPMDPDLFDMVFPNLIEQEPESQIITHAVTPLTAPPSQASGPSPVPPPPPMPVPPPPPPVVPPPPSAAVAPPQSPATPGLSDQPEIVAPPPNAAVVVPPPKVAVKPVAKAPEEVQRRRTPSAPLAPRPPVDREPTSDPRERIMRSQGGRFFYYLRRIGGKGFASDIRDAIFHDCDKSEKSLSAALSVMKAHGLLTATRTSDRGLSFLWQATPEGLSIADKCGVACFTDYGLRVPPEKVQENVTPVTAKHQILHSFEELSKEIGGGANARH